MIAGTLPAAAADTSQSYTFGVSVNGEDHAVVEPGETLDLVLSLSRDDAGGPMTIYAMSAVLRINSDLMELEDLQTGISSTVTERSGSLEGWSDITLNYLAPSMDGAEWENGVVTGYDPEHFGLEDPVTREQMAAILYRYAQFSGKDVTAADGSRFRGFSDADQVADYAKAPMTWATGKGSSILRLHQPDQLCFSGSGFPIPEKGLRRESSIS